MLLCTGSTSVAANQIVMAWNSGLSLTVRSVEEELKSGKPVHFLNFRFSVGKKGDLLPIQAKIADTGWKKLPDLENTFVWFGSNPPEVTDILKKACFDNYICRFLTGSLSGAGLLEGGTVGTTTPALTNRSPRQATLHDIIKSQSNDDDQSVELLPELEEVKPIVISDSGEEDD